jgi:hypothetical protein
LPGAGEPWRASATLKGVGRRSSSQRQANAASKRAWASNSTGSSARRPALDGGEAVDCEGRCGDGGSTAKDERERAGLGGFAPPEHDERDGGGGHGDEDGVVEVVEPEWSADALARQPTAHAFVEGEALVGGEAEEAERSHDPEASGEAGSCRGATEGEAGSRHQPERTENIDSQPERSLGRHYRCVNGSSAGLQQGARAMPEGSITRTGQTVEALTGARRGRVKISAL